jgi:hypothetical protein
VGGGRRLQRDRGSVGPTECVQTSLVVRVIVGSRHASQEALLAIAAKGIVEYVARARWRAAAALTWRLLEELHLLASTRVHPAEFPGAQRVRVKIQITALVV